MTDFHRKKWAQVKTIVASTHDGQLPVTYHEVGNGPTIIFMHGWGHSALVWKNVIELLSERYRCIAVDLPGFGASDPPARRAVSAETYIDICSFLTTQKLVLGAPITIVADSMSAIFFLRAAMRVRRMDVGTIVLSGVPLDGLPEIIRKTRAHVLTGLGLRLLKVIPHAFAHRVISRINHLTVWKRGDFEAKITDMLRHSDPYTSKVLLSKLYRPFVLSDPDVGEQYDIILMRGEHDQIFQSDTLRAWGDALLAEQVTIHDAGHTPMLEQPGEYADHVERAAQRSG